MLKAFVLASAVSIAGSPVCADVVTDWNALALNAIRAGEMPPPQASRALAILHAALAMFYGTDGVPFTIGSDVVPGMVRAFASFSAAANEAAVSRLYGGIHFRSSIEDGLSAGMAIGEWAFTHYLQPKGNPSRK